MLSKELVNYLSLGATLLTPTRRLALRINQEFNQIRASESAAWLSPLVFSLEDWCLALWEQNESSGKITQQLLNRQQSLCRFEEIISAACQEKLLQIGSTAKMAYQAWELLHHWLMLEEKWFTPENKEEETFLIWAKTYQDWLDENEFLDNAQCAKSLLPLLMEGEKKTVILYGFEDLAPVYVYFFESLAQAGWSILSRDSSSVNDKNQQYCFGFPDQMTEYQAAASWAKKRFLAGDQQIAIVVPELIHTREMIEKVFAQTFDPLLICSPSPEINPYFNISAAQPLANYPIIQALGAFLKCGLPEFSIKDYATALNSCFAAGFEDEKYKRNQHVTYLKTLLKEKITLNECLRALEKTDNQDALKQWIGILTKIKHLQENDSSKKSVSALAENFLALLQCIGWPGERPLNSIEHQVVKRGITLLQELSYFEEIIDKPNYAKVLALWQTLANNTPFQAENKKAPIQILGILEAAGQQFSHLWVTGLHNEAWPGVTKSNPFIPLSLQQAHFIPHASPQREYDYCLKVTQRLKSAAAEVIFSYPQKDKGSDLEPSELINLTPSSYDILEDANDQSVHRCESFFLQEDNLEILQDDSAPNHHNLQSIKGNATSLAYMAACPFKAFAALRLNAKQESWPALWLQPKDRGVLLHRILDTFWQEYENQNTLKAASPEIIEDKLKLLIALNLRPFMHKEASEIYFEAEKRTLFDMIALYLDVERTRPFFRVLKTEAKAHVHLAGIDFHLRFDRIDQTIENQLILIDYKTGQFSLEDMWGERPRAPQLPLYYLASVEDRPSALMAIKLQSKGCQFEGISEVELGLPGVEPMRGELTWQDLRGYWQSQLWTLVEKFVQGDARVSPLEGPNTCQYCDYQSLCRVNERKE